MKAETNYFGTIDIADDKVIRLEKGMIGFPELKNFGLIFDEEKGLEQTAFVKFRVKGEENTYILVTVTVPKNPKEFTVNLKAPIIINTDNMKGTQVITEDDYPIKYKVKSLSAQEEKAGE